MAEETIGAQNVEPSAGRSVIILYGSETGNSQDMAEELGKTVQRLHFAPDIEEMNRVQLSTLLRYDLVIFIAATTGQGDMPHNAVLFWKSLLRKKLSPTCLDGVLFTTFGLGDSSYPKFNWAARKLHKRLEQLGGCEFYPRGEADERHDDGVDGNYLVWSAGLTKHLLSANPLPGGLSPIPEDVLLPPKYVLRQDLTRPRPRLVEISSNDVAGQPPQSPLPIPYAWDAVLLENKRLTPADHWQDVRLLSLSIRPQKDEAPMKINPGDCLTIYPKNFPEDAQRLIELMSWEDRADLPVDLSASKRLPTGLYVQDPCTLRDLLLHNFDITAVPRRSFLKAISPFASNPDHKERLFEFTLPQFTDEFYDYTTRPRRTILEILEEFSSVKVPVERLLDTFPLIRGRDFSIANGGLRLRDGGGETTTRIELLTALVKYRTILRKPRQGLCSRYVAPLGPGATLRVAHKPALTRLSGPLQARRPLAAIATGTGVAPARALVQERAGHGGRGPAYLFFGNRNAAADYFFRDEWAEMEGLTVFTAFSRDQQEKIYVQDVIRREAALVASLVKEDAIFLVCGGSNRMAEACKLAFLYAMQEGGLAADEEAARVLFQKLTWWQEIW